LKSGHCLLLAAAVFARLTASGQTYEAISRETSCRATDEQHSTFSFSAFKFLSDYF
jgi:hypothetical protein